METHTMGSNGGTQKPMFDGLSRQGSLYNLTLDEVQQQLGDLGKPFSSMNLDEFLKNVWTAEANQGVHNGSPDYSELTQLASASSLPRQLSLTFTKDLTKKTVYEVWQDIQQDQNKNGSEGNVNNGGSYNKCDRQATLGEMTLEDFLVKAGIVAEPCPINQEKQNVDPPDAQWMHYQIPPIQQQQVVMSGHYQVPVAGNSVMQMTMSPTVSEFGRKRVASGDVVEKTVERRQKRMIKNRESAARSRARKQAYTHELENKISRLEEENERLRRQKEVEKVLPSVVAPPPQSKYQLRRTSSALF